MKTICFGLLLMICLPADNRPVPNVQAFCQVAKIIVASKRDTAETLASIRAHNAKVQKLCR